MSKRSFPVKITEAEVILLQKAETTVSAYKDAVISMISQSVDATSESFRSYNQLYLEASENYQNIKLEIEYKYRPEETMGHEFMWSLDYNSKVMTYHQLCECEDLSIKCLTT